jgi:DNA-directed RNA polymerase specialized sigma24 family protein
MLKLQSAARDARALPSARAGSVVRSSERSELRIMLQAAAHYARRVAQSMKLKEVDLEDIEQDILLALVERRHFFDPARGLWSSFVDLVARQAAQAVADKIGAKRRRRGRASEEAITNIESVAADSVMTSVPIDVVEHSWLASALLRFCAVVPDELASVVLLALREGGDLAEAQRRSGLSTSEFYRRVREIRCRLICAGIVCRPPRFMREKLRTATREQISA